MVQLDCGRSAYRHDAGEVFPHERFQGVIERCGTALVQPLGGQSRARPVAGPPLDGVVSIAREPVLDGALEPILGLPRRGDFNGRLGGSIGRVLLPRLEDVFDSLRPADVDFGCGEQVHQLPVVQLLGLPAGLQVVGCSVVEGRQAHVMAVD